MDNHKALSFLDTQSAVRRIVQRYAGGKWGGVGGDKLARDVAQHNKHKKGGWKG